MHEEHWNGQQNLELDVESSENNTVQEPEMFREYFSVRAVRASLGYSPTV